MSEDQVLQAFEGDAIRLVPPEKNVRIIINSTSIGGEKFGVRFVFDAGGSLESVGLSGLSTNQNTYRRQFEMLEDNLVGKYGAPPIKREVSVESLSMKRLVWSFPSTTITLLLALSPAQYVVGLVYSAKLKTCGNGRV